MPNRMTSCHLLCLVGPSLVLLTACSVEKPNNFAPICPQTEILPDAADLYTFADKHPDQWLYHASITNITGNCAAEVIDKKSPSQHNGGKRDVRTRLSMAVSIERGTLQGAQHLELTYFIAVMHDDKIVQKRLFSLPVTLDQDATNIMVKTPIKIVDNPASPALEDTNYSLKIGLQLTHAQLSYNRTHLPPADFRRLNP